MADQGAVDTGTPVKGIKIELESSDSGKLNSGNRLLMNLAKDASASGGTADNPYTLDDFTTRFFFLMTSSRFLNEISFLFSLASILTLFWKLAKITACCC